jgi:hypothetical protein
MDQMPEQEKKFAPAPPESEMTIRTMDSDIKSIEQGGGEVGAPKIFSPSGFTKVPEKEQQVSAGLNLPGYAGPEKSIFQAQHSIVSPGSAPSAVQQTENSQSGGKWKTTAIVIGDLIRIAGLVFLGYFVIFPWLFPAQIPAVQ